MLAITRGTPISIIGAVALGLWALAANVGEFRSVRAKPTLATAGSHRVLLPLSDAERFREPYVVLIYRVRNTATTPITVSAMLGETLVKQTTVAPRESTRVDVAWQRSTSTHPSYLQLTASSAGWQLEYLEVANLHGFTRGAIEFVILPARQPFMRPAAWVYAAAVGWVLLLVAWVPVSFPRVGRRLHYAVSAVFIVLFAIAAISSLVPPFRIVLAPHTYVLGLVLLAAPQMLSLLQFGAVRLRSIGLWAARRTSIGTCVLPKVPWFEIVGAGALATFTCVVWSHVGAYGGGADQSGYLNGARLLARGDISVPVRPVPILSGAALSTSVYSPLGFRPLGANALVPMYPIGLPLMIVAVSPLTGLDDAAHVVLMLSALAGVFLTALLARTCGLSRWGSLLAAAMLATSPMYLLMSVNLMSDTPALVWVSAAVLLAWHSRSRLIWAPAAGVAFAIAVLTRPTNILAIVPIAICLGFSPRRWSWFGVAGLPGAALLIGFNLAAYGTAFTTGYGDFSHLFRVANVAPSARHYLEWLPVLLTPIGVLALGLPVLLRRTPRNTAVLISWSAVFVVFYAFYFHTHEAWWSLRFLMPGFPPLIVGSLLVGHALVTRARARLRVPSSPPVRVLAGCLLGGLVVAHNAWWGRQLNVLSLGQGEYAYVEAAQWTRAHLPSHAPILAMQVSGAFFYYTDFPVLRYDFLGGEAIRKVQAAAVLAHQPLYAVLFPYEIEELHVFRDFLPGTWAQIGAARQITIWEYRDTPDGAPAAP